MASDSKSDGTPGHPKGIKPADIVLKRAIEPLNEKITEWLNNCFNFQDTGWIDTCTVILATNLKSNIDEAFSRRFQSVIYFPMPDEELRATLWRNMLPKAWLGDDAEELIAKAAETELSGGSIANVVRRCAIELTKSNAKQINNIIMKYCSVIYK